MKANHLAIMSLEEYEPNPEFVGRNFNAGEVIQLVLKAPFTGHWLSFRTVQMVMMHELAHCVQMNHSGAFWKVRNQFAGELKELWGRGYTGDGFWGRGKTLLSEQYEPARPEEEVMPRSLCGGTFRSSRRKRKRKGGGNGNERKTLTYAERQQRRIAKKFGTNGITLGDDVDTRVKLEDGKKPKGKPRVAGSARGRELRAAAALARFGQQVDERIKNESEPASDSETESDYEEVDVKAEAVDLDGSKMRDGKGHGLVNVCGDADKDSVEVKREMEELHELNRSTPPEPSIIKQEEEESTASEAEIDGHSAEEVRKPVIQPSPAVSNSETPDRTEQLNPTKRTTTPTKPHTRTPSLLPTTTNDIADVACPVCSLTNDLTSLTCTACSNVLKPEQVPRHWRCRSHTCSGSIYVNAGDCGVCGICGVKRPTLAGD